MQINDLFITRIFPIFLTLFLSGCSKEWLSVQTDYLSHENLASFHVGTPDPMLESPPIGQRLMVSWKFKKQYLACENLHLVVQIHLRDRSDRCYKVAVNEASGIWMYDLINRDFIETRGILSYKVNLYGNGELLDECRHQLWVEPIILNIEADDPEEQKVE